MPDLAADIAQRVKKLSKAAVPAGGDTGRVLTKTGPGDFDTGWQLAARLPSGGAVGDVLTKTALPDGAAGWAAPGAGGGFPVGPFDDGTSTFEIQTISVAGSSGMQISIVNNSSGAKSLVELAAGNSGQAGTALEAVDGSGNTVQVSVSTNGDITLAGGVINANLLLGASSGDKVLMPNLPTSDPGNPGQLYVLAGVLMVSP